MKKLLVITVMLLGSAAWACPDLTGSYSCAAFDENGNMYQQENYISMDVSGNVVNYTFGALDQFGEASEYTMPADNQLYSYSFKDQDTGNDVTVGTKLTCAGSVLDQFMSYSEKDGRGAEVSRIEVNVRMSLDASGNLVKEFEYRGDGQTFKDTFTCARIVQ